MQVFDDTMNIHYNFYDKYKAQKSKTSYEQIDSENKNSNQTPIIPQNLDAKEIAAQYSNASSTHVTQDIINSQAQNRTQNSSKGFSFENVKLNSEEQK